MNYLSQPNTGLSLLTSQLISGRDSTHPGIGYRLDRLLKALHFVLIFSFLYTITGWADTGSIPQLRQASDVSCNNKRTLPMLDNIIDKINQGLKQQILAFFILWFAVYGTIWTILEPLNLEIIENNLRLWRIIFICGTLLISTGIYFTFLYRKKLECIGLEAGDTNLLTTVSYSGAPTLVVQNDGFHGKLLNVIADHGTQPLNWNVKASANKAKFLTITYKPEVDFRFYARVNVLSKNKKSFTQKWLRFEPNMSLPQSTNDDEEMGIPVTALDDNGLLRVNVNLPKTISTAFGKHGWTYDKIVSVRSRGPGKIKNIVFK